MKINNDTIKFKKIAAILTGALLLIAIFDLPYGYYSFLRLIVTISAVFIAWLAYQLNNKIWLLVMIIVAILFNPIIPVHFNKEAWVVIDFIVAILFFVSVRWSKLEKNKNKQQNNEKR